MPFDENEPLSVRGNQNLYPVSKSKFSRQRGSILAGVHPNRVTVFEDHNHEGRPSTEVVSKAEKESARMDRIKLLEDAVRGMRKKNEQITINVKSLNDRISTNEANFVELKYELRLAAKPSPSTPARSRRSSDSPVQSPNACPSLAGAEENTTFASPPVPALQRKLLMNRHDRRSSGLRSEVQVYDYSEESMVFNLDSVEVLAEAGDVRGEQAIQSPEESMVSKQHRLKALEEEGKGHEDAQWISDNTTAFPDTRSSRDYDGRPANPPPVFDPDQSLGDVSIVEGISSDVARASRYLDADVQCEVESSTTTEPAESSYKETSMSTRSESEITPLTVDAIVQTDAGSETFRDIGIQALPDCRAMNDTSTQTSPHDDQDAPHAELIAPHDADISALRTQAGNFRKDVEPRYQVSPSEEPAALTEAYKALLKVEVDKKVDLETVVAQFQQEVASLRSDHAVMMARSPADRQPAINWIILSTHFAVAMTAFLLARVLLGC